VIGVNYHFASIAAQGGTGVFTYAVSGTLPPGLTFSSSQNPSAGNIDGTPTTTGTFQFTVNVTDSQNHVGSRVYNLTVVDQLSIQTPSPLVFLQQQNVSLSIATTGGVAPLLWLQISGTLPPGLQFNAGTFSGVPTTVGTYVIWLQVRDAYVAGPTPQMITLPYTIEIHNKPPAILTSEMPVAIVGQSYDQMLSASGGARPFTWTLTPAIPGLVFDTAQGRLSGVPTTPGTTQLTVTVSDSTVPAQQTSGFITFKVVAAPRGRNDSIATATPVNSETILASLSPYVNAQGIEAPDTDYYKATANGGAIVTVDVTQQGGSAIDPVLEIVNAAGQRLTTCKNPGTDDGIHTNPIVIDPTPNAFDDVCLNDDIDLGVNVNSSLSLQIPPGSPVTFYIHVLDWTGNARPDLRYSLAVTGVN
jgi:hypothetical protein